VGVSIPGKKSRREMAVALKRCGSKIKTYDSLNILRFYKFITEFPDQGSKF
jgi:hypothetical protein